MSPRANAVAISIRNVMLRARLAWIDLCIDAEECARDRARAECITAGETAERLRRRRVLFRVEHQIDLAERAVGVPTISTSRLRAQKGLS